MAGDDDRREQPRSELEARIVMLEGELTARDATIAELQAVIKQLAAQHEALTERLNRSSRNSHLPPSSDAPGAAARGKSRGKAAGKRKRGGQKGTER